MRLTRRIAIALWITTLYVGTCVAQDTRPVRLKARLSGTVVLADVEDKYNAEVYSKENGEADGGRDSEELEELKKESARRFPRRATGLQKKTTAVSAPVLGIHFVADSNSGVPADNYMSIGKDKKAVSVINSNIAVHDGATGAYLLRKGLKPFSAVVGLNSSFNDYRYDPKIIYDPEADRHICVMLNGINASNYIVIGFSTTSDPLGAWNFYKFYGNYNADTTWFDYPAISITKKEFFLTGNKIRFDSSWQAGFAQTLIYQFDKQDGYNGDTAIDYQIWDNISYGGRNIRCLHPVKPGEAIGGPEQYFLSNRNFDLSNDSIFLVRVPDTIGGSGTLTVIPLKATLKYGLPPDGRQPDTSVTLATNDGRILGAYQRGSEIQFVSATVHPTSGSAGIYHGTISNVPASPVVTANIYQVDSLDMGYPNISYVGNSSVGNRSIITFNYTGPKTYPAFGAVFYDGLNYSDITTIKAGDSSIKVLNQKQQRWGDYSGSQPEWGTSGVIWAEGIFGHRKKTYGNYMAQIMAPTFINVPEVEKAMKARLYPNPAFEFVSFEFTLPESGMVSFGIFDITGRLVDQLPAAYCREGEHVVRFNVAVLPAGTYVLKVTAQHGKNLASHKFERQ